MSERLGEVVAGLQVFLRPGQVTNLRAFNSERKPIHSGLYRDVGLMARESLRLEGEGASGVYFTLNPIKAGVLPEGKLFDHGSVNAEAIAGRSWLPIDADPVRFGPDGNPLEGESGQIAPSTDAERAAAWEVISSCREILDGSGFRGGVLGDSCNGWHLCYPIDLPPGLPGDPTYTKVAAFLAGLDRRCGTPQCRIDQKTKDAPRIWKVYGTLARKGETSHGRPYRYSQLVEGEAPTDEVRQANNEALDRVLAAWRLQDEAVARYQQRKAEAHVTLRKDIVERAKAYVAKEEPAVSGQNGHDKAFHVACVALQGFDLTQEETYDALQAWNDTCKPPWDEKELRHKIDSADKAPCDKARGYLLRESKARKNADGLGEAFAKGQAMSGAAASQDAADRPPARDGFPVPIPASLLRASDPETAWLWKGFLVRNEITLFSALWKSGKTTMLAHLLRTFEEGGEFLGYPVRPARVLYVTEEHEGRWAERRDKLGLKDHLEFLVRPFKGKPRTDAWEMFLGYLTGLIAAKSYDLVVMDTLANLWPVKDENDASAMQSALMPMHSVVENAALLLVHHTRKGDGGEATASRGSGALTGFVDTILEFRRYEPGNRKSRKRVLTGYGRHEETPSELVIELSDAGNYTACGDRDSLAQDEISTTLLAIMPRVPPGDTVARLLEDWPCDTKPSRSRLLSALSAGAESGLWAQEGMGKKGSPYTYWVPGEEVPDDFRAQTPPPIDEL